MLQVGLVGTGFGLDVYAQALQSSNVFKLHTVCDRDIKRAKEAKKKLGFYNFTDDWRSLADSSSINLIIIATPAHTHFEIAKYSIERNKHVMVSPPFTMTAPEAEELTKLASSTGVTAVVDFHYNYIPSRRFIVQLIKQGKIGQVHSVDRMLRKRTAITDTISADSTWKLQSVNGGGLTQSHAPHDIDFLLRVLGGMHKISAKRFTQIKMRKLTDGSSRPSQTDDGVQFTVQFHNGAEWHYTATEASVMKETDEFIFYGSEGLLHLHNDNEVFFIDHQGKKERLAIPPAYHLTTVPGNKLCTPFFAMSEAFSSAVYNSSPISPTFDEALHTQRVMDAIFVSDKENRWVEIGTDVKREVVQIKSAPTIDKIF